MLIAMAVLPASGKSTLAAHLANGVSLTPLVRKGRPADVLRAFCPSQGGLAPFHPDPAHYPHNRTGEANADAHRKRQIMGR